MSKMTSVSGFHSWRFAGGEGQWRMTSAIGHITNAFLALLS